MLSGFCRLRRCHSSIVVPRAPRRDFRRELTHDVLQVLNLLFRDSIIEKLTALRAIQQNQIPWLLVCYATKRCRFYGLDVLVQGASS